MSRIDKENLLLQTLMAICGATLLAVGIVTVVSAWRGPQRDRQPELNQIGATTPATEQAEEPIADEPAADEEPKCREPASAPTESVADSAEAISPDPESTGPPAEPLAQEDHPQAETL